MAPDGGQYPMWGNSSEFNNLSKKPLDQYLRQLMPPVVEQYEKMKKNREVQLFTTRIKINFSVTISVNVVKTSEDFNNSPGKEDDSADQQHSQQAIPKPTQNEISNQVQKAEFQNTQQALRTLSQVEVFNQQFLEFIERRLKDCASLKCTELVTQLSKLKAALISYVQLIDQILLHYTLFSNADTILPAFETVNESKTYIQSIMKKMNPEELEKLLPQTVNVTKDNFLSAILGLNEKVTDYLTGLSLEDRSHEPDQYYITNYLREIVESTDLASQERTIEACMNCGFTESRANLFALWLENRFHVNHQPLSYWIELYMENLFKYNILLSNQYARYPYNENTINEWFTEKVKKLPASEEDCSAVWRSVEIFNSSETSKSITKDKVKYHGEKEEDGYWYHGTDHMSACNIIKTGIKIGRGRQRQDFSDDDGGFYVSPTFPSAKKWALNKTKSAVLIFNVDKAVEKFDGMDLMQNQKNEWSAVVKYNRCGGEHPLSGELRKRHDECDYIVGPRSGDGSQGTKCDQSNCGHWQPFGYDSKKSATRQLCIRSKKMAQEFRRKLEGVIFY